MEWVSFEKPFESSHVHKYRTLFKYDIKNLSCLFNNRYDFYRHIVKNSKISEFQQMHRYL